MIYSICLHAGDETALYPTSSEPSGESYQDNKNQDLSTTLLARNTVFGPGTHIVLYPDRYMASTIIPCGSQHLPPA